MNPDERVVAFMKIAALLTQAEAALMPPIPLHQIDPKHPEVFEQAIKESFKLHYEFIEEFYDKI